MSQEIINVLNYICEKIGVAIDWTADNIWPQVLDILERYCIFKVVGLSIWMFVIVALAIVFAHFGKIAISNYKSCYDNKKDNIWFSYSNYYGKPAWCAPSYVYTTGLAVFLVFAIIGVPIIVDEMLKWILVPEIQYLDMLRGYIQ